MKYLFRKDDKTINGVWIIELGDVEDREGDAFQVNFRNGGYEFI